MASRKQVKRKLKAARKANSTPRDRWREHFEGVPDAAALRERVRARISGNNEQENT